MEKSSQSLDLGFPEDDELQQQGGNTDRMYHTHVSYTTLSATSPPPEHFLPMMVYTNPVSQQDRWSVFSNHQ